MCSTSGPKASGLTVYTFQALQLSIFGWYNARQNSDLVVTSLTNRKVLKRTNILQIKANPDYGDMAGTDLPAEAIRAAIRALTPRSGSTAPWARDPVPSHQLCLNPPSRTAHTFWRRNPNFFLGRAKLRTAAVSPLKCTVMSCFYSHQEWIPGESVKETQLTGCSSSAYPPIKDSAAEEPLCLSCTDNVPVKSMY